MRGAQTEGESRILSKVSGLGKFLSPTRFAGAPSQRGPKRQLHIERDLPFWAGPFVVYSQPR